MSRRKAEEAIAAGRVTLNGQLIKEMGITVNPMVDRIEVDGREVGQSRPETFVLALYKPRRVITSKKDPEGRKTIMEFISAEFQSGYPVGRLDFDSEGLLLFTNDGALAQKVMHPSSQVKKIYEVRLDHPAQLDDLKCWTQGVELEDGVGRFVSVERLSDPREFKIVVEEGRNRFIRRMCSSRGFEVERLKRVQIGQFKLVDLLPGQARRLSLNDVSLILT